MSPAEVAARKERSASSVPLRSRTKADGAAYFACSLQHGREAGAPRVLALLQDVAKECPMVEEDFTKGTYNGCGWASPWICLLYTSDAADE